MANAVFANGREIACKAAAGKTICAMPDVCFTPPENPATPPGVPIPYPNTGMASDTSDGSKKVKISDKEVGLKNKSSFKKSMGDEAGAAAKKGVVTSKNTGKVFFNAWSMDVKIEGQNAVRHLDLTTNNHASFPGDTPTWPYLDAAAFGGEGKCKDVAKKIEDNCLYTETNEDGGEVYSNIIVTQKGNVKRKESMEALCADDDCKDAMKCVVSPYDPNNCCPDKDGDQPTPHHIVPKSQYYKSGYANKGSAADRDVGAILKDGDNNKYNPGKAPCICASGSSHSGEGDHPLIHSKTNTKTRKKLGVESGTQIPDQTWDVSDAESIGSEAVSEVFDECPKGCIEEQVRKGHNDMDIKADDKIRPTTAGGEEGDEGTGV